MTPHSKRVGAKNRPGKEKKKSGNSCYGGVLNASEQRVLETVEKSSIPITPLEIASKTKIKHSYVRSIVRKLSRLKFVYRPFYGHYESMKNLTTLGGFGGGELLGGQQGRLAPHVHNLQFVVHGVKGSRVGRRVLLDSELVRVTVNQVSDGTAVVYVKGEFDAFSFPFLIKVLKSELGVSEKQIEPKRVEFNNDIQGIQLERSCLTVRGIQGDLIRLYNKSRKTLRREVKPVSVPATVAEIEALIQGGMPSYYILQGLGLLVKKIEDLSESQKFLNEVSVRRLVVLEKLAEALLKRLNVSDESKGLARRGGS